MVLSLKWRHCRCQELIKELRHRYGIHLAPSNSCKSLPCIIGLPSARSLSMTLQMRQHSKTVPTGCARFENSQMIMFKLHLSVTRLTCAVVAVSSQKQHRRRQSFRTSRMYLLKRIASNCLSRSLKMVKEWALAKTERPSDLISNSVNPTSSKE